VVAALHARECALARDETTRDAPDSDIGMDGAEGCDLLPAWPDTGIWRDWAGDFDVIFAAQPHYAGRPMETGAFARWQCQPLLHDLLRQRPGRLLARLVARLYDLLDSAKKLARRESAQRIQWVATETGVGLALAHTARGLLIHHARVEQGRIADYCIVPPTAWNFHPRGAWRAGLVNLRERDILRLSETAWCLALSLDPCVAYTMRVCHA
jgi:Ni,Fe-hydrogenase I large subunit